MNKRLTIFILCIFAVLNAHAVLKEKNLEQTLSVLRAELTETHHDLISMAEQRKQQTRDIIQQLRETIKRSNQNALMLYSQQQNYVFDLTYACHEATEQYLSFQRQQLPFKSYIEHLDVEIAKYDSLVNSLKNIRTNMLEDRPKTDRVVCLTLSTAIRNSLQETRDQVSDYITIYENTEQRLKYLNDYANRRYNDIQTGIFKNGGENYISLLRNIGERWEQMKTSVEEKYRPSNQNSDWDSTVILKLFFLIFFYIMAAIVLNMLAFRFMPKRFHTTEFLKKRSCIIMATTTVTFAAVMGVMRATLERPAHRICLAAGRDTHLPAAPCQRRPD